MAITPEIKKAVIKNQIKVTAKNAVECKINLSEEELGNVILSTPKGIITGFEAKTLNVGGELLLKIF